MKPLRISLVILIIAVMAWIFHFSGQPATESDQVSVSFAAEIIERLPMFRHYTPAQRMELAGQWNGIVRKYAHFSIYGLLGFLCFALSLCYSLRWGERFGGSMLFCIAYAMSDEVHQLFVPGRSGELKDVLIDSSGALFGCLLMLLLFHLAKKLRRKRV